MARNENDMTRIETPNRSAAGLEKEQCNSNPDAIIINEAQLILAEKRTSLAAMRTGIALFILPLSVFSLLIATSRFYNVLHVLYLFIPVAAISLALVLLGSYLIIRAFIRIHRYDRMMENLKSKNCKMAEILD